ncbi:hypothetical protein F4821DRAFT_197465 [Hypoxylon rubiginosum]|uniref:Uncharacterized protein n=1 Tax=Hypoxylon rubiginosum TaxID=110542 RepID=A0ACC0CRR4_9PEZI|nr:hypothetical protein F4821DRAFT_197465 [Hypoxylon rubiginosum]
MPHRSFFHYNITRAYPFKWFTPLVIIGGIILTALVSFLNVAATGYELVSTSSSDPNATETNSIWFSKWPSYLVGARAACEAASLQVQSTIYTDRRAFPYELSKVWHVEEDGTKAYQGSLIYKNNVIQNCNITEIKIQFEGPDRSPGQLAVAPMGGTVTAKTECYIDADSGRTYFQMRSTYDAIPPPETAKSTFLNLNKTSDPTLFWGYSLLNMYWRSSMQAFFDGNADRSPPPFFKGVIDLNRNTTLDGTMEEQVESIEFLRVGDCFFIPLNSTGIAYLNNRYCNSTSITELSNSPTNPAEFTRPLPGIWRSVEGLGKSMWFTVLADLGRNDDAMPNMLARPKLLASLSSDLATVNETLRSRFRWGLNDRMFMQAFDPSQDVLLQVSQSILATDYLCQVPQLKSPGTLFISILVADLVILQALWKIFTLTVDGFFLKSTEEARHCANCAPVSQGGILHGGYKSVNGGDSQIVLLEEQRSSGT